MQKFIHYVQEKITNEMRIYSERKYYEEWNLSHKRR